MQIAPRKAVGTIGMLAVLVTGCATNPATGRSQIMLVSESQEIAMGREYDQQVIASIGLYPDSSWQRYLQQFGARLAATGERPELPWTFRVVDDPSVNAFALPGGFIYVTRGLLAHMNSEAELAAVVGHEIGHVTARHTVSQMSTQQLAGLGLAIGSIASKDVGRYAGLASSALGLLFLKYSRDDETQADELGLRYMRRANFDPRQMPAVFVMLERVGAAGGGGRVPTWLATHPTPENRYEHITGLIAAMPDAFAGMVVDRNGYLQRLDGLLFGPNPRDGFFRSGRFYHPDLRFQLAFPEGWTTDNGRQAVVAINPARDAVIELAMAQEPDAAAAARAFLAQDGITGGASTRATVHGLPTVRAPFRATTENGMLRGTVLFVEHRGAVYGLIGYAVESAWPGAEAAVERTLGSFETLTDPAALNAQPQRVSAGRLDRPTTIAALAGQRASPASAEILALINMVDLQTALVAGQWIKWIVGPPLPYADAARQQ